MAFSKKHPPVVSIGGPPQENPDLMRYQQTLSSAQIKTLATVPIQLLPAPGPGKIYNIDRFMLDYKFGTVPYVLGDGTLFVFAGYAVSPATGLVAGFLDQSSDQLEGGPAYYGPEDPTPLLNQPLTIATPGSTDASAGDGTLLVIVYYSIESL